MELSRSWYFMGKENSQGMNTVEKVIHAPEHNLGRENIYDFK